ncbi:diguanylate cyclase domain-containing protein [Roseateles sp. BYS87W]|uniref:diguanylate cyclase n=1 Tax=Pelomonas baiyunensis TaxID=3299026 RepID=A0ABW7GTE7_9BURK
MDSFFSQLSASVTQARSLEELTRPLLEVLETVTGLESTYLTTVDLQAGRQQVVFAHNTQQLRIPEGLSVPWDDTLCKRALDEGVPYTDDVAHVWKDSEAAQQLGIQTYVSTPVRTDDGSLFGTLCAASSQRSPLSDTAGQAMLMFARLIEQQVERERLVERLHRANAELQTQALTDVLTGLPNRRALMQEMARLISLAQRTGSWLLAGCIDLDGFKQINDTHGHAAGDAFLCAVAARLQQVLRSGDVLARLGGDEFVVVGLGPRLDADGAEAARLMQRRLAAATVGSHDVGHARLDYPGASVGVACLDSLQADAAQVLHEADAAMYRVKQGRRLGAN